MEDFPVGLGVIILGAVTGILLASALIVAALLLGAGLYR